MLLYIDTDTREIHGYNNIISKEDAKKRLSDSCIWIEGITIPKPEIPSGKTIKLYLTDENSIRHESVDLIKSTEDTEAKWKAQIEDVLEMLAKQVAINTLLQGGRL